MSSDMHRTIVVGKAGSGKSTFAKARGNVLDLDDLIRREFDGDFGLYRPCTGERALAQDAFCARIRELILVHTVIEGSVRDYDLIRRIFTGYKWRIFYVLPSSAEVYAAFVLKRFMEEPGHARIGWLSEGDPDGKMLMLKSGVIDQESLEIIKSWVGHLAKGQYVVSQQLAQDYAAEFPDNMSVYISQ